MLQQVGAAAAAAVVPPLAPHLPAAGGEDVLVLLVPVPLHNLAGVRLVLLLGGVAAQAHVLVHVEVVQRPRLAARLGRDELVKGEVLAARKPAQTSARTSADAPPQQQAAPLSTGNRGSVLWAQNFVRGRTSSGLGVLLRPVALRPPSAQPQPWRGWTVI
eukprot:scaffold1803_cov320-Prasinococcus_capsulatus_cf.AAC.7